MAELWDVYDKDRNPTGRTHERGTPLAPGEFHLVVQVWLRAPDGRWLCSKRAPGKPYGGYWEPTGGAALAGEDSLAAALRETREELGLELDPARGRLMWKFRVYDAFADVWMFECPFTPDDVTLQPSETCGARFFTSDEILNMLGSGADGDEAFMECSYAAGLFSLFDPPVYRAAVLPRGTKTTDIKWEDIPAVKVDRWFWRDDYAPETEARLCLIEDGGIALKMTCRESDPVARHTEYGDEVWVDSAMECFLAAEKGGRYINIEMNSAANKLVGVGEGREGRLSIDAFYPCPGVTVEKGGGVWSAETFYPKEALDAVFGGFECRVGARMWGNFFKVGEETAAPHYGMWSAIISPDPDFHRPEFFSEIIFIENI